MNRGASPNRTTSALRLAAMLVVLGLRFDSCVAADNILGPFHPTIRMPIVGGRTLGFTTQLEIANENSAGYVPVKITFNAVGNLPTDRRLIYRFQTVPDGQTPPQNGLTVDVPINVAQGTRTESFVRYLPKWSAGQALDIAILEDGRYLEDYDAAIGSAIRGHRRTLEFLENEHLTNWVFISAEDKPVPKTVSELRDVLPQSFVSEATSNRVLDPSVGPRLQAIGQGDLPSDWRSYQRFDVIAIQTKTLNKLQTNEKAFRALREWVLNGGAVLVFDAPSPQAILDQLNFHWTNEASATDQIGSVAREFYYYLDLTHAELNNAINLMEPQVSRGSSYGVSTMGPPNQQIPAREMQMELKQIAQTPRLSPAQWNEQVWMQPAGAGLVIGIRQGAAAVPSRTHWTIAARTLGARASPTLRRGVDPLIGDGRFARWLIPGVAQPPVYTFMGLLTAFVILVGPIAYRRTAKIERSYLMFAIAPALALVTTLAMFGYGIVSDGFGTVVRVRQVTWVDGRSGDAGERVRSTYFAGVRPGDGLRFPGDAEVIGYPQGTGESWEDHNKLTPQTIGKVLIRSDSQTFDSSFLPSRQQRQFIVHQPRNNVGYLSLTPDPDTTAAPKIESSFDFVLHEVLVRDDRGDYWFVDNLNSGRAQLSEAVDQKAASKLLGRLYNDHRPISTVRETRRQPNRNYNLEVYDVIADINRQLGAKANITEGLFEQWLQQNMQTLGEIPDGHFVATADISSDVLAVQGCQSVASIRYIIGTLR